MKRLLMLLSALLAFQGCDSPFEENSSIDIPVDSVIIDSSEFDISEYPSLSEIKLDSSFVVSGTYAEARDLWDGITPRKTAESLGDCDYLLITTQPLLETALAFAQYRFLNSEDAVKNPKVVVIDHWLKTGYGNKRAVLSDFFNSLNTVQEGNGKLLHLFFVARPHELGGIPLPHSENINFSDVVYFQDWELVPAIGRIPVENNIQGAEYLAKVIITEAALKRDAFVFGDDKWSGDYFNPIDFVKMCETHQKYLVEQNWSSYNFNIGVLAEDTLVDTDVEKGPLSESKIEQCRDSLIAGLNATDGIFVFNGTFGDSLWTDEEIVTEEIIPHLKTNPIYFTTARAYDMIDGNRTLSEKFLLSKSGTVATISVSHGMTYAATHANFVSACLESIDTAETIGTMFTIASVKRKNPSYTIMGDPALNITGLHR